MKASNLLDFNKDQVFETLNKFKVTHNPINRNVVTYIDKKKVDEYKPKSSEYQVVDFASMAKEFINQLESHMKITKFNLQMTGIQELRLYGDQFNIGDDVYYQQASLTSSTNGLRRFSLLAGIFRKICSNGAFTMENGTLHTGRHFKNNENILKAMEFEFGNLDQAFTSIKQKIESLRGKKTSLITLRNAMVEKDGTNITKFLALLQKLIVSKTDRIPEEEMDKKLILLLSEYKKTSDLDREARQKAALKLIKTTPNLEIDNYKLFQCNTEIYRGETSDVIQKETENILTILK